MDVVEVEPAGQQHERRRARPDLDLGRKRPPFPCHPVRVHDDESARHEIHPGKDPGGLGSIGDLEVQGGQ